jgi:hypothetical protein
LFKENLADILVFITLEVVLGGTDRGANHIVVFQSQTNTFKGIKEKIGTLGASF